MERRELNEIYMKLDKKAHELSKIFQCAFGYYNRHYYKNESGQNEMDYFPIPVITIENICDIEIGLNEITVTTKLTKDGVLSYDFEGIKGYNFEAYGVEDYLDDFYTAGSTIDMMLEKVSNSSEENVFFSFCFPFETDADTIYKFVKFIRTEGFFY